MDDNAFQRVGLLAQTFMEDLDESFPPDAVLGDLMIVAVVNVNDGHSVQFRATTEALYVQRGLIRTVQLALDDPGTFDDLPHHEEGEDDEPTR